MRIAVVGVGAIGASWVRLLLDQGHEVVAADPAAGADRRLREVVGEHERLTFTAEVADAARHADFVQENGPERIEAKHEIFAALDAAARPEVVLASSSSGLLPTDIQRACRRHPDRVLVGHPFNPPHLMPLVEVVAGQHTSAEATRTAIAFYASLGKRPIRLRQEVMGHVANRLQAALWREAYSLVERGVASVAEIDTAIAYGPGLRWALLGPFLTQHLSGGAGGIAHILEHLGPPTERWWADLGEPALTPELSQKIVQGVADELAGVDVAQVRAERDELLAMLLAAKAAAQHL